jgi:hypothetical protein
MADIEPEDYDRLQEPTLVEIAKLCESERDRVLKDRSRWSLDEMERKQRLVARAMQALNAIFNGA